MIAAIPQNWATRIEALHCRGENILRVACSDYMQSATEKSLTELEDDDTARNEES